MEWQLIESASTNGEWFLVARISYGVIRWWYRARFYRGHWRTGGGVVEPTHWLPLPDPPKENTDGN